MSETITTEETLQAAKTHFINAYKRILKERLQSEMENEGDLSRVTDSLQGERFVDGSFLTGVDEQAYTETISEYAWRLGSEGRDLVSEELQNEAIYQDMDYQAIIAEVEGK